MRLPRCARLAAAFLASACFLRAAAPTVYQFAGGSELAISVTPEKPSFLLGEPGWLIFRIENRGPLPFIFTPVIGEGTLGTYWAPNVALIQVTSSEGKPVGQPIRPQGFGGSFGGPRPVTIPPGGFNEYRYFLPVWAAFEEPGIYQVHVRRTLGLGRARTPGGPESGGRQVFEARGEIVIAPHDPVALGRIITEVGEKALAQLDRDEFRIPSLTLYEIDDPRTIPFLERIIFSHGPGENGPVASAFQPLAKFDSDDALALLKRGLAFGVSGLPPRMQAPNLAGTADGVRNSAAAALGESRHPRAFETLAAYRHDPFYGVRDKVLHAAARQPPAVALPILEEMTRDPRRSMADEARRYIGLITAPGYVTPAEAARRPPIVRRGDQLVIRYDARPADLARFKDELGVTSLAFTREGTGPYTYLGDRDLALVKEWISLRSIELGPIPLTDEAVSHLGQLAGLEGLTPSPWLTEAGLIQFARLTTDLSLVSLPYGEATVRKLTSVSRLKRLTLPPFANDATLTQFEGNAGLESLHLANTYVTDLSMAVVARFRNLRSLTLSNLPITEAGLAQLAGLAELRSFAFGNVTDAGMAHLSRLSQLDDLQINGSRLTDASLEHLSRLTRLRNLWVSGSSLTRLPSTLTELTHANLSRTPIGDSGVLALADLPKLTTLELQETRLTDAGLARLPELKELIRLELDATAITDAALDSIARLPKLESLGLGRTRVTPAGLAKLAGLKNIRRINGTGLTPAQLAELIPALRE